MVARKLIVKSDDALELFIGVAALAALFAVQRYLAPKAELSE